MMKKNVLWGIAAATLAFGLFAGAGNAAQAKTQKSGNGEGSQPKLVGAEKVLYLDGKDSVTVTGKRIVSVTWSSSKPAVATVSAGGAVRPVKKGNTKISAKVVYRKKAAGKTYTKKLRYSLKVLGKAKKYFVFSNTTRVGVEVTVSGLTEKGKQQKHLYIPDYYKGMKVVSIDGNALEDNQTIRTLHLADGIRSLYGYGINNCKKLRKIFIGSDFRSIGINSFIECPSLEEFVVDSRNEIFWVEDGILYEWASQSGIKSLVAYPRTKEGANFSIPIFVDELYSYAFADCVNLKEVILSEEIRELPEGCFEGSGLESIYMPDTVRRCGWKAFANCTSLQEVKMSKTIQYLNEEVFKGCTAMERVTLPVNLQWVEASAFRGCENLKELLVPDASNDFYSLDGVLFRREICSLEIYPPGRKDSIYTVPEGVEKIAREAFYQADVERVILPEGLRYIDSGAFEESGIVEMVLPDTVRDISRRAFKNCRRLVQITLSKNVKELCEEIFSGCSALAQIELPEEMNDIGEEAFCGCDSLESFLISEGNTTFTVKDGILYSKGMHRLYLYPPGKKGERFTMPDSVTRVESYAFYGARLKQVDFTDTLKHIGFAAFEKCEMLEELELPESIGRIDGCAFRGCRALQRVLLPSNIRYLSASLFEDCIALKKVQIPDAVQVINKAAFRNCTGLEKVVIGTGCELIDSYVFMGCNSLKKLTVKTNKLKADSFGGEIFVNAGADGGKGLVVDVPDKKIKQYRNYFLRVNLSPKAVVK